MNTPVLSVDRLVKVYRNKLKPEALTGVRSVSLHVHPGEVVGLIGESGCGKTTLARCVARLSDPDDGVIMVNGHDFGRMRGNALRRYRKNVQFVFQRPENSLNPRMTVFQFVREALRHFEICDKAQERDRVRHLSRLVSLKEEAVDYYPHQLSGGERQRVAIMRALACEPSVIILDEPTSALDVSVQAQVLRTLKDLQQQTRAAYLFISHDVGVIRYICSRVYVMYLGVVVEEGPSESIFASPRHPYTKALFSAVPRLKRHAPAEAELKGELTSSTAAFSGCPLRPRCPHAWEQCRATPPPVDLGNGHVAACWLLHDSSRQQAAGSIQ